MSNHTYFISDLHLQEDDQATHGLFENWVKANAKQADAVYILGDLFEFWAGDDDNTPYHQRVVALLRKLTQAGVAVYFMPGNRDFLIGERFLKETGLQALPDPTVVTLHKTRVLLSHGDAFCTEDVSHQRFRSLSQHKISKKIFLSLPLRLRKKIAKKIRTKSQIHAKNKTMAVMDVTNSAILKALRHYKVSKIIHGHTHQANRHLIDQKDGKTAERIVLGDWYQRSSFLSINDSGHYALTNTPVKKRLANQP